MILVATNFSDASEQALKMAIQLAGVWHSSMVLFHVQEVPVLVDIAPASITPVAVDLNEAFERAKVELEASANRVRRQGIECTVSVSTGKVHKEIVEQAEHIGADLIALGKHAHHGIGGALSGGIAEKVLRHAPCPILVVPLSAPGEA